MHKYSVSDYMVGDVMGNFLIIEKEIIGKHDTFTETAERIYPEAYFYGGRKKYSFLAECLLCNAQIKIKGYQLRKSKKYDGCYFCTDK